MQHAQTVAYRLAGNQFERCFATSSGLTEQSSGMQDERLRSQALQPFAVGPPSRGVIGTSKYAQRLKSSVMNAAKDPLRLAFTLLDCC